MPYNQQHRYDKIEETQSITVDEILATRWRPVRVQTNCMVKNATKDTVERSLKYPFDPHLHLVYSLITAASGSVTYHSDSVPKAFRPKTVWSYLSDPNACADVDVALSYFIHSKLLLFTYAEDMNLMKVIDITSRLPTDYKPPNHNNISVLLLNTMYVVNWNSEIITLLENFNLFVISLFGYGEMIKTIPMVNDMAAELHNPFAFLMFLTDHITFPMVQRNMPRILRICSYPWLKTCKIHTMCT